MLQLHCLFRLRLHHPHHIRRFARRRHLRGLRILDPSPRNPKTQIHLPTLFGRAETILNKDRHSRHANFGLVYGQPQIPQIATMSAPENTEPFPALSPERTAANDQPDSQSQDHVARSRRSSIASVLGELELLTHRSSFGRFGRFGRSV